MTRTGFLPYKLYENGCLKIGASEQGRSPHKETRHLICAFSLSSRSPRIGIRTSTCRSLALFRAERELGIFGFVHGVRLRSRFMQSLLAVLSPLFGFPYFSFPCKGAYSFGRRDHRLLITAHLADKRLVLFEVILGIIIFDKYLLQTSPI